LDKYGQPAILYTGGNNQVNGICLALPADSGLLKWNKWTGNPVINKPPPQYSRSDFRDPFVWKDSNNYYMIVGYGIVEHKVEKGSVLLFRSNDLKHWEYLHPLYTGDPEKDSSGIFWEMPVFRKLQGKYILLVNRVPHKGIPADALYWTGDFIKEKFVPDNTIPRRLEVINRLLSPSVTTDALGRTTAIAIIPDLITPRAQYEQGWTHLYSIPRVWQLKNRKICQSPHPVLKDLRTNRQNFKNAIINPDQPLQISTGKHQLEIRATIDPKECKRFGFILGKDPEAKERTTVYYDFESKCFVVDRTRSSQKAYIPLNIQTGKYALSRKNKMDWHMFIDGSVVEVFINHEDAFTTRIFPKYVDSNGVELYCEGGSIGLEQATMWTLKDTGNKNDFK
jgi:sucrose-6-phosphate hydrolase SacC (GH32 family)